jgi:hypothetical protein
MRAAISANEEMIDADQGQIRASQEKMEAPVTATQEKMKATINVGQEKIGATIRVIWSVQTKFNETIHKWVLGLASVDQWTHTFCKELDSEIQGA